MSVYVALKYDDCVRLLTDGASWDENGNLAKVESKVYAAKATPLAVSGRGDDALFHLVAKALVDAADRFGNVEAAIALFNRIFKSLEGVAEAVASKDAFCDFVVTGYSETRGFFILTGGNTPDGVTTPSLVDGGNERYGCPKLGEMVAPFLSGITPADRRFLKVRGVEFFDAIRLAKVPDKTPWGSQIAPLGSWAGGICELTTVTREGCKTELLRDYRDPLGEPINPYRDQNNVKLFNNRKERRAHKAQQKGKLVAL